MLVFEPQQLPAISYCVLVAATRQPLTLVCLRLILKLVIASPLGRTHNFHAPVDTITGPERVRIDLGKGCAKVQCGKL